MAVTKSQAEHTGTRDTTLKKHVAFLESENKKLIKQLNKYKKEKQDHRRQIYKNVGIGLLVFLTASFLNLAIISGWLKHTVVNTNVWVDKTTQIIQNPSVRNDISNKLASDIITKSDAEGYIKEILPQQVSTLAQPLTNNLESFLSKQINQVIATQQFTQLWQKLNRSAHNGIVSSLKSANADTSSVLYIQGNKLVLNLEPVIDNISSRLSDKGFGLVQNARGKLHPTFTIAEIQAMPQILRTFNILNKSPILFLALAIVCAIGALLLAKKKYRVAISIGATVIVLMIINVQVIYFAQYSIVNKLTNIAQNMSDSSAKAIFSILTSDLIALDRAVMALAIVLIIGAFFASGNRYSIKARLFIGQLLNGKIGDRFALWISDNANVLLALIIIVALLFILFPLASGYIYPLVIAVLAAILCFLVLSIKNARK